MTTPTRTVLVTGANKGVGRAVAEQLAALGTTVWLGARDTGRGRAAEAELRALGHDVRFVQLDVTDDASVQLAAKHIEDNGGRLDALVNNAGYSSPWIAPSETPADDVQETLASNVVGVVRVTNAMLPLLRRSDAPRIVNVGSVLGSVTAAAENHDPTKVFADGEFPVILAYSVSKAALNSVTVMYANELRADGVLVNSVSPNWVPTDANGNTGVLSVAEGAELLVRMATLPAGTDGPTGTFRCADGSRDGIVLPW